MPNGQSLIRQGLILINHDSTPQQGRELSVKKAKCNQGNLFSTRSVTGKYPNESLACGQLKSGKISDHSKQSCQSKWIFEN